MPTDPSESERAPEPGISGSVGFSDDAGGQWRRPHPLSLLLVVLVAARQFALPAIFLILFSVGSRGQFAFALFLVFPIVSGFLQHFFFRYRLDEDEIIVRHGVLHRTVRHVPYSRIQNLDTSEGLLQRMLGLAQVSLETASGVEPEARFRWISRAETEAIRSRVLAARVGVRAGERVPLESSSERFSEGENEVAAAREESAVQIGREQDLAPGADAGFAEKRTLYRVPFRELVILGLFSGRGLVIFGALAGVAWELDQFGMVDSRSSLARLGIPSLRAYFSELSGSAALILLVVSIVVLCTIVTLGSVLLTASAYYGFTLTTAGRDLHTQGGLFTRQTSAIRRKRIQILQSSSPPHLRWFGRTRLRAGTAGGRTNETGRAWLVPILPESKLASLIRDVQVKVSVEGVSWQAPHPRAAARQQRRGLMVVAVISVVAVLALGPWGLVILVLLPLAWVHAGRSVRYHGHAMTENAVYARHGWLWRSLEIVPFNKIQTVLVVESPFDRRWGMATLHVDTAAAGGSLAIPYLSTEEALRLQRELVKHAGTRGFHW